MSSQVTYALALSLFAGLATGIGSLIALFSKSTNHRFISFSLGLSAGVMVYISFMEILFSARLGLTELHGQRLGETITALSFFGGMVLSALIDRLVPEAENPHELHSVEELTDDSRHHHKMHRVGILTAIAITVHNFPEGIATFMSAISSPQTGIAIAVAVAIHNIPEGIAVSVPVYAATGNRRRAFCLSFLSGLAEPLGAVIAYLILMPFLTPTILNITFAAVAGIMVFISLDELLPAARQYGENHIAIFGVAAGMAVMAFSLILL